MLDLSFGLPITVRDAALKMVAPGPTSSINREYYAQEHEKELEDGKGAVEEYEKTDEKARELLKRLANSEPYYKKQRRLEANGAARQGETGGQEQQASAGQKQIGYGPGPVRNNASRANNTSLSPYPQSPHARGSRPAGRTRRPFPGTTQLPPQPKDILPPADPNITSLFVTGVEDDLPEHAVRAFFTPFGAIRSIICSHRAHCAFINYAARESAEKAAEACQGKAVIQGCPLRVQWGKPKPLDNMDRDERMDLARQGRRTMAAVKANAEGGSDGVHQGDAVGEDGTAIGQGRESEQGGKFAVAPPPGAETVPYASLAGD